MKRYLIPLACILPLLAACSGQPPVLQMPSSTAVNALQATGSVSNIDQVNRGIAAAEQTLTLLYQSALIYTSLPRCGTGPSLCSDIGVVREIRRRAIEAHNALVAARKNEALVEYAWTAISAFRAVVPAS